MRYLLVYTIQGCGNHKRLQGRERSFRAGRTTYSPPEYFEAENDTEAIKIAEQKVEEMRQRRRAFRSKIVDLFAIEHRVELPK